MDVFQEFTQEEQELALSHGFCPRCGGPIRDLRGCGFAGSQVGGCFRFGTDSWECRTGRPGSRSGIKISDVPA
jgi:hypothetical protein